MESAGGIQHVGPPESYSGVQTVGNGKRSEDRFQAAAKQTKSEGGKKRPRDRGAQNRKMQKIHKRKYIPTAKK
ncbi:Hypothetical predicted protein [Pelobates cultripes]|uniref:Uncharacterized protein n=1 Tax=Pelobates cultripes TaxID=61616 RepID=A0AAD1W991_PELCU|nr:Hypothetical predicted protein [Pelobates cultripes]